MTQFPFMRRALHGRAAVGRPRYPRAPRRSRLPCSPQCLAICVLAVAVLVLQMPVLPPRRLALALLFLVALLPLPGLALAAIRRWRVQLPGPFSASMTPASTPGWLCAWPCAPYVVLAGAAVLAALITLLPAAHWQASLLPDACERVVADLSGVVRGLPRRLSQAPGNGGHRAGPNTPLYSFELAVAGLRPAACGGPRRVRLYYRPRSVREASVTASALAPGASVQLQARLRRPWGLVNPHARDGERRFLGGGIHAVGSVSAAGLRRLPDVAGVPWRGRLDRLRDAISNWLRAEQGDEIGGLLAALAVGDRRFITAEGWTRLRVYGLTHAFVISGLHITLIALPGWALGGILQRIRGLVHGAPPALDWLSPVLGLLFAGLYACLAGLSLPTLRAFLALWLALLPMLLRRPLDRGRLLACCGLLLWLLDPTSVIGASYWLSLGAVALLLWYSLWTGPAGGVHAVARTQVFMLLGMLPLGLFWFGEGSTIGGAVNLVAVPLLTLMVIPLLLGAVAVAPLAEFPATVLLDPAASAVAALWYAMGHWEPLLQATALLSAPAGMSALLLALTATAMLAMPRFRRRGVLIVLLAAPLFLPRGGGSDEALRLTVFDVGQGTAVLLRQGGDSLLYDTGGGPPGGVPVAKRSVLPLLRAQRLRALDHLVISHADRDHDAGETLVRGVSPPRHLWHPLAADDRERCRLGRELPFGSAVRLRFLSLALPGDSDNDGSCVLLIEAFGQRILLPGDIEHARERDLLAYWGSAVSATVMLAAHHGSGTSSGHSWIRIVDPKLVIITAARANHFGHPHPAVLDRFEARRIPVLNTAYDGAIALRVDRAGRLSCRRLRHRWQPFWRRGDGHRQCTPPAAR